jgi:hypothetical protein
MSHPGDPGVSEAPAQSSTRKSQAGPAELISASPNQSGHKVPEW